MMSLENLRKIAENEFADIVIQVLLIHINEMRIILSDRWKFYRCVVFP